jgi:predicted thioesterase
MILGNLAEEEEGMGAEVKVKHLAPATEGTILTLEATVICRKRNFIITRVLVRSQEKVVGEGEVTQAILPKSKIERMISIKNK